MEFCPQCDSLMDITQEVDDSYIEQGGGKFSILFDLILNNKNEDDIKKILDEYNIDIIKKSDDYKSLSIDKQELIYNKIESLLSKKKKTLLKTNFKSSIPPVYYNCVDCKYTIQLKSGVNIFSETKNKEITEDYAHYINSNIHEYTTEYVCINSDCKSHTTGGEALYFRNNNKIMLICKECNTQFYKN